MDANHEHCFSAHNSFVHNYAGQQMSGCHTGHIYENYLVCSVMQAKN